MDLRSSKGRGQVWFYVHLPFPSTNFIAIPLRKDLDFMNIMKERLKTKDQLKSQPLTKVLIVLKIVTFWVVKLKNNKPHIPSEAEKHALQNEQETFLESLVLKHLIQVYLPFIT